MRPYSAFIHRRRLSRQGAVVAFTPASLSPNIWIEADPAKLYTDAGITLVSADGQAVQQANDKSSNAHNVSQATLASRPIYHTGSGKPYLQFDGTASSIASATAFSATDGSGQCWIAVSASLTDASLQQVLAEMVGASAVIWARSNAGNAECIAWDNAGNPTTDVGSALTSNTPFVLIAAITTTAAEVFVDNASGGSTALTGTRQTNSANMVIGSNIANQFTKGNIYGVVQGSGTLTSTDRASLQTYMAALHP